MLQGMMGYSYMVSVELGIPRREIKVLIDSIVEKVHDSYANGIVQSERTLFIKNIAKNNRIFSHIFQKRQSFKGTCFHNVIVGGLIITSLMNNRSCNTMKTYTETYPVGRYVIYKHGYYIRAGFD
jgi:hypothetical protein